MYKLIGSPKTRVIELFGCLKNRRHGHLVDPCQDLEVVRHEWPAPIAIPVSKLDSGGSPASELAEAERRADRTLAARSLLGPAADSRARSVAGWRCNVGASSRSGLELRAAS